MLLRPKQNKVKQNKTKQNTEGLLSHGCIKRKTFSALCRGISVLKFADLCRTLWNRVFCPNANWQWRFQTVIAFLFSQIVYPTFHIQFLSPAFCPPCLLLLYLLCWCEVEGAAQIWSWHSDWLMLIEKTISEWDTCSWNEDAASVSPSASRLSSYFYASFYPTLNRELCLLPCS